VQYYKAGPGGPYRRYSECRVGERLKRLSGFVLQELPQGGTTEDTVDTEEGRRYLS